MFLEELNGRGLYLVSDSLVEVIGVYTGDFFRTSAELPFVEARYRESHRYYHTEAHVIDMLRVLTPALASIHDTARKIRLVRAVIYHDVYYAPGFPLNERYSANLARRNAPASMRYDDDALNTVDALIMVTKDHHLPKRKDIRDDAALIIDADLSRIGGPHEEFVDDSRLIGLEFWGLVTPVEYRKGRSEWAKTFLKEHPKIFRSDSFSHLEDRARENLESLIM
jgi:predicted metal-dependent HD superfamily phosphohydrolase